MYSQLGRRDFYARDDMALDLSILSPPSTPPLAYGNRYVKVSLRISVV
jgi:hypothetical protein